MKQFLMIIKADYNDADYVTSVDEIKEKTYLFFQDLLSKYKIKDSISIEDLQEKLTEDEFDKMAGWFPAVPDSDEIHTIEEIFFYKITEKITLI